MKSKQTSLSKSQSTVRVVIPTTDDNVAEQDGTVTLTLIEANSYHLSEHFQSKVVISDFSDRQRRLGVLTQATQDILSDLTNTIGSNTLKFTNDRIEQAFSISNRTATLKFNGYQDLTSILTSSGKALNENTVTLQDFLGNSSFTLSLSPENFGTNTTTLWGIGDNQELASRNSLNQSSWDGINFTGHLGIDTMMNHGILTGFTTSITESEFEHTGSTEDLLLFRNSLNCFKSLPRLEFAKPRCKFNFSSRVWCLVKLILTKLIMKCKLFSNSYLTIGVRGNKRIYSSDRIFKGGSSELTISGKSWIAQQRYGW